MFGYDVAQEVKLMFANVEVPNTETVAAMEAARRGELVTVGSPEDLLASLNESDEMHREVQAQAGGEMEAKLDGASLRCQA